jgi:colanic acid/amylovoran biosynthesis glycosyltransferase
MTFPLAVINHQLGTGSETFIRRHMEDLLPQKTVIIVNTANGHDGGHWDVECPKLILDRIPMPLPERGFHKFKELTNPQHLRFSEQAKEFIQRYGVQVILGEFFDQCFRWLPLAEELKIPFFAHAHGYDISVRLRQQKWRTRYLSFNEIAGMIVVSHASRNRLIDLGLKPDKIHVVPCGILVPQQPQLKKAGETIRCLAVGRMVGKKAPLILLETFRRAAEVCPNLTLDYIGAGKLLPKACKFIASHNLEKKVTLHGSQPHKFVEQLMQQSDIFLQHSITDPKTGDEEGLPVAILEAMSFSLPVVSTYHAGIPEAVQEGYTGFLVEEGDSLKMSDHIITLARAHNLRVEMGKAGWQRAKENFSWQQEADQLKAIMKLT